MKKLSLYIFLVLMWCNIVQAASYETSSPYWSTSKSGPTSINQAIEMFFKDRKLDPLEGIWMESNWGLVAIKKHGSGYRKYLISVKFEGLNGTHETTYFKTEDPKIYTFFTRTSWRDNSWYKFRTMPGTLILDNVNFAERDIEGSVWPGNPDGTLTRNWPTDLYTHNKKFTDNSQKKGTYWSNKKDGPTSIEEAKSKFGNRKLDTIEGIWFDNHKWSVGNVVIYKKDNFYRMNIVEGDTDFNGTWEGTLFKKENLNYDYIGRIWYPQSDGSYTFDTQESDIEVSKSGDYFYSNFKSLTKDGDDLSSKFTRIWPTDLYSYNQKFSNNNSEETVASSNTQISDKTEVEAFCLIKRMDLKQANLDPKDYSRFAGKEINFLISFDENLIVDVSAEDEVSVITGMYGPTDMQKFKKTANGINYKNEIDIKGDKEEEMLKYNYNNTIRIVDGKPTSLYAKVDQSGWSFNSWNFQIDCRDHKYSDAEKQQAKNLLIGEKPPTPKFDKKKADMFLRAICKRNYQNLSLEMKKKCDAAFPVNPFKKQKEYVCRNSSEESIKLKIYAIYKDKYVVISEQNPDLDNVEMVYFGKITTDDKQLTFFSINSEEKILTVFNLQEIKDNKRKFIHQMFQLDDEELKNVLNTNTVFDKKLDDPNPSVYVKQQDIEIGIVNNTINIFQSIKNMSEEKLDKKKLDLKEYFCDVNKF